MAHKENLICIGSILALTGVDNCTEVEDPSYNANSRCDWDYRDGRWDRVLSHVNKTEGDAAIELEWADLVSWYTASDIECYLHGRYFCGYSRDAVWPDGCDDFTTFARMHIAGNCRGRAERPFKKFSSRLRGNTE